MALLAIGALLSTEDHRDAAFAQSQLAEDEVQRPDQSFLERPSEDGSIADSTDDLQTKQAETGAGSSLTTDIEVRPLGPPATSKAPSESATGPGAQDAVPEEPGIARLGDALRELEEINPVVATIDGQEIRWAEVIGSAEDLSLETEDQVEALFPALLDRLVDLKLVAGAARGAGLDQDETIQAQVRRYEENLIRERYVQDYLETVVDETNLRERYDVLVETIGSSQQIHARHILVPTREEAEVLIDALDDGADFALLARKYSKGPSGARGGDLGYFDPGRMVPEFSEAALALEVGSYTAEPVRSPFGWHVIELLDHSVEGVPPFNEMEGALREQLTQEALEKLLQELRQGAELEFFPDPEETARRPPAQADPEALDSGPATPRQQPEVSVDDENPDTREPDDGAFVPLDPTEVPAVGVNPVPLFTPAE